MSGSPVICRTLWRIEAASWLVGLAGCWPGGSLKKTTLSGGDLCTSSFSSLMLRPISPASDVLLPRFFDVFSSTKMTSSGGEGGFFGELGSGVERVL